MLVTDLYFSDNNVRNSVFSTVSKMESKSSRICITKKSSWYGLRERGREREGGREGGRKEEGERERGIEREKKGERGSERERERKRKRDEEGE